MFMACKKDEIQAEDSIEGVWDIIEITSLYAEFSENGFDPSETISETGQLGTFTFMQNSVDYTFTRNDTLYSGSKSWNLELEKIREGFSKVNDFTLSIEDDFLFDVTFEDGTKNSEKNAKRATFEEWPTSGFGVGINMILEKR